MSKCNQRSWNGVGPVYLDVNHLSQNPCQISFDQNGQSAGQHATLSQAGTYGVFKSWEPLQLKEPTSFVQEQYDFGGSVVRNQKTNPCSLFDCNDQTPDLLTDRDLFSSVSPSDQGDKDDECFGMNASGAYFSTSYHTTNGPNDNEKCKKRAHAKVEKRYRSNMNALIQALDMAMRSARSMTDRVSSDGRSSGAKPQKADILLSALEYIKESEIDMRSLKGELELIKVRLRACNCG